MENTYLLVKIGTLDTEDTTFATMEQAKAALLSYKKKLGEDDDLLKFQDTDLGFYASSDGDYQVVFIVKTPTTLQENLLLLAEKAYAGLSQYAVELEDSWVCGGYIDQIVELVKTQMQEPDDAVRIEYGGKTFVMTTEEIEAAYRYKDDLYGVEDAKAQLNRVCFGDRNVELDETELSATEISALNAFADTFGAGYDIAMQNLDLIYATYAQCQQSDRSDDDNWEEAIYQACHALKKQLKMSEKDAMRYLSTLKPGITKQEFLADCGDMGFWFDDIQGNEMLEACYEALKPESDKKGKE